MTAQEACSTPPQVDGAPALAPGCRAYRGRLLTPLSTGREGAPARLRFLDDALLVVDRDGRIAWVGEAAGAPFRGAALDLRPAVLLPGFVDAHLHYPQTRITGSASGALLDWLERSVFPEEARFADPAYAVEVAGEFTRRMLAAGTTTCAAYSSAHPAATDRLFEELDRAGIRAIAGLTLMDQACPEALRLHPRDAVPAARDLLQKWHGAGAGRLGFAVTPRFAPSCSRALLEAAAQLAADHRLLIQTHVAEQPREAEIALRAHPYGESYLDIYDKVGLLNERTLLAHAIHLSSREWDRLAEAGARVVHCPDSNFFLGSGRKPIREPQRRGVPVSLGSDVGAGRSFDLRRAMSHAFDSALCTGERLTPTDLLAMATLGGAAALGLADRVGALDPGKEADFIVVRCPTHAATEADVLAQLVFASDATAVLRTYVRGAQVHPRD
jgi:guanine deaminase